MMTVIRDQNIYIQVLQIRLILMVATPLKIVKIKQVTVVLLVEQLIEIIIM
jgi:hypothetical protein